MPNLCGAPHCRRIIKSNDERASCSLCSRIMHRQCQQHVITVGYVRICFFCNLSPEDTMTKVDSLKEYFSEKIEQKKKRQEKERNNKTVKDESRRMENKEDKRNANKKHNEEILNKNDIEYKQKLSGYIEDERKMSEKLKEANNIRDGNDIEDSTEKIEFEHEINIKGVIKEPIECERVKSPEIKIKDDEIQNGDDDNYKIESANQRDVPANTHFQDHNFDDTKMEDRNGAFLQARIIQDNIIQPQYCNMHQSKIQDYIKLYHSDENNKIKSENNKESQQHMVKVLESVQAQNKLLETRVNGLENTQNKNTWCTLI